MTTFLKRFSNLIPVRASGSWVFTKDNRWILDLTSGIGACSLGHSHPLIIHSLYKQSEKMIFSQQNCWENPLYTTFLNKMNALSKQTWNTMFLTNSGSEAVDACLKFYMKLYNRPNILSICNGFHGRTFGASGISSSIEASYYPQKHCKVTDIRSMKGEIDDETAVVILETLQGEGGLQEQDYSIVREIHDECKERNVPFVIDEVQSGGGRTGKWFHHEYIHNICPDAVIFGKAIGNGMPLAGILFSSSFRNHKNIPYGMFGGTYNGNLLSLNTSITTMDIIRHENMMETNIRHGEMIKEGLKQLGYLDIYGKGLMLGFRPKNMDAKQLQQKLIGLNILVLTAGYDKLIRLLPSYIIEKEEIEYFLDILGKADC